MKKRQNSSKTQGNNGDYSGSMDAAHLDSQDLSSAFMSDADRRTGAYHADPSSAVATLEAPIESPATGPVAASAKVTEAQNSSFNSGKSNGNSHNSNGGSGNGHNGGNHGSHGGQNDGGHGHDSHGSGGRGQDQERRRRRRALISAPVRVRSLNITEEGPSEVTTTIDVSRGGIFFVSELASYEKHMEVAVVFPFSGIPGDVHSEQLGQIVRVVEYEDGRRGIAVSFEKPAVVSDEALVDSGGRQLQPHALRAPGLPGGDSSAEQKEVKVLILEADSRARESMSSYLGSEGYAPMTVSTGAKAREMLATTVPAVVIADVEGDSMAGFDICAFIKSDERLRHVHVILVTSSAYPSDYANAHAVGATICMAKPFKQEKLGQMVKLLAPPRRLTADKSSTRPAEQGPNASGGNGNAAAKRSMVSTLSSNGYTKPVAPTPAPAAEQHEFRKLCDAAVNEKHVRDGDRYDTSETDQNAAVSVSKDAKVDSKGSFAAFRNKAASLFKR
jgi:CheY-like chemotaxis protein